MYVNNSSGAALSTSLTGTLNLNPLPGFASSAGSITYTLVNFTGTSSSTPSLTLGTAPSIATYLTKGSLTNTAGTSGSVTIQYTRTAGAAFTWTGSGTGKTTPNNWWNPADWTESGVSYLAPISGDTAAISLTNNPIVDVGTTCTTNCGSGTLTGIASFTNLPTPAVKSITLSNEAPHDQRRNQRRA